MNGCPVPDATQWKLVKEVSDIVKPVYDALAEAASNCDVIALDDTRATILSREQDLKQAAETRTGTFTSGFICKDLKNAIDISYSHPT